MMSAIC